MAKYPEAKNMNVWYKELKTLGYDDPLPAPIPSVQVLICAMRDPRLHQFIQEQDSLALADVDEDGRSAPLILKTLDLSDWTKLLVLAGTNPNAGLAKLRDAHSKLIDILEKDDIDLRTTENSVPMLEEALVHANSNSKTPFPSIKVEKASHLDEDHPLLSTVSFDSAEQAAVDNCKEILLGSSPNMRDLLLRTSGKRCIVPLAPPRLVEYMLMFIGHRAWNLNCIGHLAPITVNMWQTWARLTNDDVETCRKNAIDHKGSIKDGVTVPHAFPLSSFEPGKCSSSAVKLLTKLELPTGDFRRERHLQEFWNCGRPYLRCSCNRLNSNDGSCDGSVMWWDHAVYLMINRLELFFGDDYPTLRSKLAAFWIWIASSGKLAAKCQITFMFRRDYTLEGVLEYAHEQKVGPLLTKYGDGAGLRQIERLIRPPSFSLSNAPPLSKRQKLNATPFPAGRGCINKNFRANKKAARPFEVFEKKLSAEEKKNIDQKAKVKRPATDGLCSSDVPEKKPLVAKPSVPQQPPLPR